MMKRTPTPIETIEEQCIDWGSIYHHPDFDSDKFAKLLAKEILNLANRHGNIKPREVMKYFGVKDDTQISNNP